MSSTTSIGSAAAQAVKATRVRYAILGLLFLVTAINYADRATLSIAGTALARELNFDPIGMGYLFSAFGWAYVIGQIPGGWLLDRYGSKLIYGLSLFLWSLFTLMQGGVGLLHPASAFLVLFAVRFALGLVESPAFPANNRIVAAWFPTAERGTATAIFNSAQYAAVAFFAPIMGWITASFGWEYIFLFMGALGILLSLAWPWLIHNPKDHPRTNAAEIEHLEKGAKFDISKSREGYFRAWDHQLMMEMYAITALPPDQVKNQYDIFRPDGSFPKPDESLESIATTQAENACTFPA
mgnify:CR=1 FL=1